MQGGKHTHTHIHTPEEIVPTRNPNNATLSVELKNKTAQRWCPKKGRTNQIQKNMYNEVLSGGDFRCDCVLYISRMAKSSLWLIKSDILKITNSEWDRWLGQSQPLTNRVRSPMTYAK